MPTLLFSEYFPILIFLAVAVALSCVIIGASFFLVKQVGDTEKLSAYECGFDAFEDARNQFDVRVGWPYRSIGPPTLTTGFHPVG
jgi:NADH-quinone oxidoreductase subunit A